MRILILPLLVLMGCAASVSDSVQTSDRVQGEQAGLSKALAGLTPGGEQTCIDQTRNRTTSAFGRTLVYRVNSRLSYVTETNGGCEGVAQSDILQTSTPTRQLCAGDIATVFDHASRVPISSCSFGKFTAYRR